MAPALPDLPVDAIRRAMLGPHHAHLVRTRGRAVRYEPAVGPFLSLPADVTAADWRDARALCGDAPALLADDLEPPAVDWTVEQAFGIIEMLAPDDLGRPDPHARALTPGDLAAMTELIDATQPGPFGPRTIETGTYVGLHAGGRLVAMGGERWRPPGFGEISLICTDPSHQGGGLAGRVTRAVAARIEARGDRPFLCVKDDNLPAIGLYERLGFVPVRSFTARWLRARAHPG